MFQVTPGQEHLEIYDTHNKYFQIRFVIYDCASDVWVLTIWFTLVSLPCTLHILLKNNHLQTLII